MIQSLRQNLRNTVEKYLDRIAPPAKVEHPDPLSAFHSDFYLQITARRLEHLASLNVPVAGKTVMDVSSGIGDLALYYIDRGCKVTMTDVREENLAVLRQRFPKDHSIQFLDMEKPTPIQGAPFQVVHCYGLLYHLGNPGVALDFLSKCSSELLFLETCVTPGDDMEINPVKENSGNPTWAYSGEACRPSRRWIFEKLKTLFPHVYVPVTQPNHQHFILNWETAPKNEDILTRSVFVASRQPLNNPLLKEELLMQQTHHA